MIVLSTGRLLPLDCSYIEGQRKGVRFIAKANNLVEALAHCSTAYLFPT